MTTYTWTANGDMTIEMTVSQSHIETISADGDMVEIEKSEVRIEKLTISGTEYRVSRIGYAKEGRTAEIVYNGKPASVVIPAAHYTDMMAETRAYMAKVDASLDKYYADRKDIRDAMNR
jgi:hypothetical protein